MTTRHRLRLVLLKDRIKEWRGKRSLKEAAALLNIDYQTLRKYASGKRTPCKMALAYLEDLMKDHPETQ